MKLKNKRICGDCPQCMSDSELSCFWQIEKMVPEKFKPSEIKAFISVENVNGIGYLKISEMSKPFDTEFLSWVLCFCIGNKINVFWETNKKPFWLGPPEFIETLSRLMEVENI